MTIDEALKLAALDGESVSSMELVAAARRLGAEVTQLQTDRAHYKHRALAAEERVSYYVGVARTVETELQHWREAAASIGATDGHGMSLDFERLTAERDALTTEHAQLSVIVAQIQDFVARERALRDAVGKGGQQVNGYAPSITPSVLHTLERMIRDAPDVSANYARLEAQVNRHEQDIEAEFSAGFKAGYTSGAKMERLGTHIDALAAEAFARFKASRKGGDGDDTR